MEGAGSLNTRRWRYEDFVLEARGSGSGADGLPSAAEVRVVSSPAGPSETSCAAIPSDLFVRAEQSLAGEYVEAQPGKPLERFGHDLARVLFPGEACERFFASITRVRREERVGVRLRLVLTPDLAALPWELLYLPPGPLSAGGFLARERRLSIVRQEPGVEPRELSPREGFNVLVAMAAPPGPGARRKRTTLKYLLEDRVSLLGLFRGRSALVARFEPSSPVGLSEHPGATLETLNVALRDMGHERGDVDVFHFGGHGRFYDGVGRVVLANEKGSGVELLGVKLARYVKDRGVKLAVLAACDTARRDARSPGASVAEALLAQAGTLMVVAMAAEVRDDLAGAFTKAFYETLLRGASIDEAVFEGRLEMDARATTTRKPAIDWAYPVFYLHARESVLSTPIGLDAQAKDAPPTPSASEPSRRPSARGWASNWVGRAMVATDAFARLCAALVRFIDERWALGVERRVLAVVVVLARWFASTRGAFDVDLLLWRKRASLESVYIRPRLLRLTPHDEGQGVERDPGKHAGGAAGGAVGDLRGGVAVVLGPPGGGKTSFARHLCAVLARGEAPPEPFESWRGYTPVLLDAPSLGAAPIDLCDEAQETLKRELPGGAALARAAAARGRLLLLIDGLDEDDPYDASRRTELARAIGAFLGRDRQGSEAPGNGVVLFHREGTYRGEAFTILKPEVFGTPAVGDGERRELVERVAVIRPKNVPKPALDPEDFGNHRGVLENPLMVTLFAQIAGERREPKVTTRSGLYAAVVEKMLAMEVQKAQLGLAHDMLRRLAYTMLVKADPALRSGAFGAEHALRAATTYVADGQITRLEHAEALLEKIAEARLIYVGSDRRYRFAHQSFVEYFAAEALVRRHRHDAEGLAEVFRGGADLDEVLQFCGGLADAKLVEEVVDALGSSTPPRWASAARCLIDAGSADDGKVKRVVRGLIERFLAARDEDERDIAAQVVELANAPGSVGRSASQALIEASLTAREGDARRRLEALLAHPRGLVEWSRFMLRAPGVSDDARRQALRSLLDRAEKALAPRPPQRVAQPDGAPTGREGAALREALGDVWTILGDREQRGRALIAHEVARSVQSHPQAVRAIVPQRVEEGRAGEQSDVADWPFPDLLDGALAKRLVSGLMAEPERGGLPRCFVEAVKSYRDGPGAEVGGGRFSGAWATMGRRWQRFRRRTLVAVGCVFLGRALSQLLAIAVIGLVLWTNVIGAPVLVEICPTELRRYPRDEYRHMAEAYDELLRVSRERYGVEAKVVAYRETTPIYAAKILFDPGTAQVATTLSMILDQASSTSTPVPSSFPPESLVPVDLQRHVLDAFRGFLNARPTPRTWLAFIVDPLSWGGTIMMLLVLTFSVMLTWARSLFDWRLFDRRDVTPEQGLFLTGAGFVEIVWAVIVMLPLVAVSLQLVPLFVVFTPSALGLALGVLWNRGCGLLADERAIISSLLDRHYGER